MNVVLVVLLLILVLSYLTKTNEKVKATMVKKLKSVSIIFFLPYWVLIVSGLVITYLSLIMISEVEVAWNKTEKTATQTRIENFESAKQIIPGTWVSQELLYENQYQYNVLILKQDGSLLFGQGSSIENANSNAYSVKGTWNVVSSEERLKDLLDLQRFLIEVEIQGYGYNMLRVEINPGEYLMGRTRNTEDSNRESLGLFTFGGKIFYKKS